MSESVPDLKSVRQLSDEEIEQTFDRLVEAWEGREQTRAELEAFNREYQPPEQHALKIESTKDLIEYNRQKWRYEQKREELEDRYKEHDANYNTTAETAKLLLPRGHILVHTYRGDHPELRGAQCTLEHATIHGSQKVPAPSQIIVLSCRGPTNSSSKVL